MGMKDVSFSITEKSEEIFKKAAMTSRELRRAAEVKRLEGHTALADRLEECAVEIDKLGAKIKEASECYANGIKGVLTLISNVAAESHEKLSRAMDIVAETKKESDKN